MKKYIKLLIIPLILLLVTGCKIKINVRDNHVNNSSILAAGDPYKIEIYPNAENSDLDYSIGQLVFYITEEQVTQIMRVPFENRYFAIVADTENSEQQQSTLYEGKVQYF